MKDLLRAIARATQFCWHIARGIKQSSSLRRQYKENWYETDQGKQAIQVWMKMLCRILGLQVNASYRSANTPVMLVANHVSWLDIIAIGSLIPTRFVAKNEVRQWPVIGNLARRGGTLFIKRNNRKSACETNLQIANVLTENQRIMIFPEGTTTEGLSTLAFKPALFEACRIAKCDIQPVAIRYWRNNTLDPIAPYIQDDSFITHLWRIMRAPETQIDLHFCMPIQSNVPRQELASFSRMIINAELTNNYSLRESNNPSTIIGLEHAT
ncbi:MAG: lysophospholipid acyltransferase family protein [Gammaproteobacteria bacterium]|nr:lysophospholipid acyltransferase family protein [Gammaproteobacteria bacterium]